MRALRLAAITLASLLVLAVLTAWLLPRFLDWDDYRQTIAAVVSTGLGRPVQIRGPIRLSLLPHVALRAGSVSIADTGDGASATTSEMRLRISFTALLAGQVHPRELVLQGAHMHLPWPLSARFLREGRPAAGLHAEIEDGTLDLGGLALTGITGELAVDPATGTLSANGVGTVLARSWRLTGRLGRPGGDGAATLEVSLDGQGGLVNTGGLISGVIAEDGSLSGQVSGRGPDLSLLLPAPASPWQANGRLVAGSGLAVADDLEAQIGGMLARGAVALRFLPVLRLDAALATSRLDLDALLPSLLHGERTALPTGIDLSAEAATLAGGVLRQLRIGFDLTPDGIALRDSSALLPGDAELHLAGQFQRNRFDGSAQLAAPHLADTLEWLRPQAPTLLAAIPAGVLQTAALSGTVRAGDGSLAVGSLDGQVDGAPVSGELALRGGNDPALAANLKLASPLLDPWLPSAPADASDASLAASMRLVEDSVARLGALRSDITLEASQPVWLGSKFDRLSVALRSGDGAAELRQAILTAPDVTVGIAGTMAPGAILTDARLDVRLQQASSLAAYLPLQLRSADALFRGPATLHVLASGRPKALHFSTAAALSGADLQLDGVLNLPARQWSGGIAFRHPGAPRLLEAVGLPGTAPWLGDGSLSLQADVNLRPDRVALSNVDLAAGTLRASGDLAVAGLAAWRPVLTGQIKADILTLPLPYARSPEPWLFTAGHGWSGHVDVQAGQVWFGLSPALENASAALWLDHGRFRLDGLAADVSGGRLTGQLAVDDASPPHLAANARLVNVAVLGPLLGTAFDASAGRLDASVDLAADGYSPAGLLATLGFTLQAGMHDGTLEGLDLAAALAPVNANTPDDPARVTAALNGGSTHFDQLSLSAMGDHGGVTLSQLRLTAPSGQIRGSGTLDLLTRTVLAQFTLEAAKPGTPPLGLRLSGPASTPRRTPELGDLTQWLASRRG